MASSRYGDKKSKKSRQAKKNFNVLTSNDLIAHAKRMMNYKAQGKPEVKPKAKSYASKTYTSPNQAGQKHATQGVYGYDDPRRAQGYAAPAKSEKKPSYTVMIDDIAQPVPNNA